MTGSGVEEAPVLEAVLQWWVYLGCGLFAVGCVARALRYATTPVHVRWDLYPVAHEPRRDHGGSYLEEKSWWEKPREKSLWGEISVMSGEILVLKGVWENNRRLWWGSLVFHWGLYLLMLTTAVLVIAAFWPAAAAWAGPVLAVAAVSGGAFLAAGSLYLLILRSTDGRFRPYTSPLDRMNLLLLTVLGALSLAVALGSGGMGQAIDAVGAVLRGGAPRVSAVLGAQMAVGALFVLYMPFTRMVHFFSKYFTYHDVRWDDTPVEAGTKMQRKLAAALNYGVTWSADHVGTGRTWAEVATTLPVEEQKGN